MHIKMVNTRETNQINRDRERQQEIQREGEWKEREKHGWGKIRHTGTKAETGI